MRGCNICARCLLISFGCWFVAFVVVDGVGAGAAAFFYFFFLLFSLMYCEPLFSV